MTGKLEPCVLFLSFVTVDIDLMFLTLDSLPQADLQKLMLLLVLRNDKISDGLKHEIIKFKED